MSTNTKKSIVLCIALVIVILAAWFMYNSTKPVAIEGVKNITIEVNSGDGRIEVFNISTSEEYLGGALEAEMLVEGETSQYGLFIKTVNGVTADESKQQWWCVTKGGADVYTGADMTPIADGDKFELELKTGY